MFSADHLQFFLEVSRHGRLVDAARVLGVDHTTVGRRITTLEKSTGQRLFDRTPAGWQLTDAGRRLVSYAETIESTVIAAFEDQTSTTGALTGSVRISAPDGFGAFVLVPRLPRLRHTHPMLDVELVTATEHDALSTRGFDIAVTLERPSPRTVAARKLASYELRLYASRSYLDGAPPVDTLDDLRRHVIIWYVDALLDVAPLRILDAMRLDARPRIQINNITGQWLAAREGVGIAPLPNYIGESDDDLVRVLPRSFAIRRDYWTVVPRDLTRLARVKAVDNLLRWIAAENVHLEDADAGP